MRPRGELAASEVLTPPARRPRVSSTEISAMHDLAFLNPIHNGLHRVIAGLQQSAAEPPLRVAARPIDLHSVIETDEPPCSPREGEALWGLPCSRFFDLGFEWSGTRMECEVSAYGVTLPTLDRVYIVVHTNGHDIVAAASPVSSPDACDGRFLRMLLDSNGVAFGTPLAGCVPGPISLSERWSRWFWRTRLHRLLGAATEFGLDFEDVVRGARRTLENRRHDLPRSLLGLSNLDLSKLDDAQLWEAVPEDTLVDLWLDDAWLGSYDAQDDAEDEAEDEPTD